MDEKIEAALHSRSVSAKISPAGKIVKRFDASKASEPLQAFLSMHPSCRVVFDAMVKSGFVNPIDISKLRNLSLATKTSFLADAKCKRCGRILDSPNLADVDFEIRKKKMSCPECHTLNSLVAADYTPSYETINRRMLTRVLRKGEQVGFLTLYLSLVCPFCGRTQILLPNEVQMIDLKCPKCNVFHESSVTYVPSYPVEMSSLIGDSRQGYWLEWYLWKKLSGTFPAEPAMRLVKGERSLEVDSAFLVDGKLSILECRDSSDVSDFLEKLPLLNQISDTVLLATTTQVREQTIEAARKLLRRKFIYVHPRELEDICKIVGKF